MNHMKNARCTTKYWHNFSLANEDITNANLWKNADTNYWLDFEALFCVKNITRVQKHCDVYCTKNISPKQKIIQEYKDMEKKPSLREFAKLHGVEHTTFWNWLKQDKEAAESQGEDVSFWWFRIAFIHSIFKNFLFFLILSI